MGSQKKRRANRVRTLCYDPQVVGPYRVLKPLRLTVLTANSEDYTTAPQHLHAQFQLCRHVPSSKSANVKWGGGILYVYGCWGLCIKKSLDLRYFGIINGVDFHDFGIKNGIHFYDFGKKEQMNKLLRIGISTPSGEGGG